MAKNHITISKLTVRGFKSIVDEQVIEIRPLTVLAGANSSGKSSLIQPLLLLKQTIESPSDPGALRLDGPNVRFTQADQLISRVQGKTVSDFVIRIGLTNGENLELTFKHEKRAGFDIEKMEYTNPNETICITPKLSNEEIEKLLPKNLNSLRYAIEEKEKTKLQWAVYRDRCFLFFDLRGIDVKPFQLIFQPYGISPSTGFLQHIKGLIHLPGHRGNPRRTYDRSGVSPDFPGTFENYIASIIAHWQITSDHKLDELEEALKDIGLTWKVEAKPVDDTQVELRVGRLPHSRIGGSKDMVSIADVGFGVSQSLPVVVALVVAKPGQVVYIEQPEIHLHPRAQRRLAHLLGVAVRKKVTVIVETHSALLLREIQTLVARGELTKDKVRLHWFKREPDGRTVVTPAELDNDGSYGDWPEDFDEVALESEKDFLDAGEARMAKT